MPYSAGNCIIRTCIPTVQESAGGPGSLPESEGVPQKNLLKPFWRGEWEPPASDSQPFGAAYASPSVISPKGLIRWLSSHSQPKCSYLTVPIATACCLDCPITGRRAQTISSLWQLLRRCYTPPCSRRLAETSNWSQPHQASLLLLSACHPTERQPAP